MQPVPLLDCAGRRRSPANLASFHEGHPPRNKSMRDPPDPPTVEEIIADEDRERGRFGRRPLHVPNNAAVPDDCSVGGASAPRPGFGQGGFPSPSEGRSASVSGARRSWCASIELAAPRPSGFWILLVCL